MEFISQKYTHYRKASDVIYSNYNHNSNAFIRNDFCISFYRLNLFGLLINQFFNFNDLIFAKEQNDSIPLTCFLLLANSLLLD